MMTLPTRLYLARQVRELDRIAIEERGIAGGELMERAGKAAFKSLRFNWPRARRVSVVCGPGNNGGDGFVVARLARQRGLQERVISLVDPQRLAGDAARACLSYREAGGTLEPFDGRSASWGDVIVDGIFGTGLEREVSGVWGEAVTAINASGRPVLALDIPSGLHADTGRILGAGVKACLTVSFIGLKAGAFTAEGPESCGEIIFDDLDVPAEIYSAMPPFAERLTQAGLRHKLPRRPRHIHKGRCGHVLVVGGNLGMAGAARMAGEAAYRSGAGLVSIATHPAHAGVLMAACPELMVRGVDTAAALRPLLQRASVVALGPGLGQDDWARQMLAAALESSLPLVVDADALNLVAAEPLRREDWVLTPHPGEAARLLKTRVADVQGDRFNAARTLAEQFGGVCVLKGAGTVITDERPIIALCDRGNPGMASGGMGDVLTGIIAALQAQGMARGDAARLGVWVHAGAGDSAGQEREIGLMATDLLAWIPLHLKRIME